GARSRPTSTTTPSKSSKPKKAEPSAQPCSPAPASTPGPPSPPPATPPSAPPPPSPPNTPMPWPQPTPASANSTPPSNRLSPDAQRAINQNTLQQFRPRITSSLPASSLPEVRARTHFRTRLNPNAPLILPFTARSTHNPATCSR